MMAGRGAGGKSGGGGGVGGTIRITPEGSDHVAAAAAGGGAVVGVTGSDGAIQNMDVVRDPSLLSSPPPPATSTVGGGTTPAFVAPYWKINPLWECPSSFTRTLAHYDRHEQIGEGTYGQVYRAICRDTGQTVALKKIRMHHGGYVGMPLQLIREIKILKRLQHPNLLRMVEVITSKGAEHLDEDDSTPSSGSNRNQQNAATTGTNTGTGGAGKTASNNNTAGQSDKAAPTADLRLQDAREAYKGNLFLVLEYVEHDLTGLSDVSYQFTPVQIKCIFQQLLQALAFLHRNRYIHRDLKSSNILLDSHFRLKLADFGLARSVETPLLEQMQLANTGTSSSAGYHSTSLDLTNKVVTLWYRAPELLFGAVQYTAAVDIWSAACIFAELWTSRPIFTGKTEMDQMKLIIDLMGTPKSGSDTWHYLQTLKKMSPIPNKSSSHQVVPFQPFLEPSVSQKSSSMSKTIHDSSAFVARESNLREKYRRKIPEESALNLLEKMLDWDARKRITAANALENRYFWLPPVAPSNPAELGRLEVGQMGHFHEFQTKPLRKEAKAKAEKERLRKLEEGATAEEANTHFDKVYRDLMHQVAMEGCTSFAERQKDKAAAGSGLAATHPEKENGPTRQHEKKAKEDRRVDQNRGDRPKRKEDRRKEENRDRRKEEDRDRKREGPRDRRRDDERDRRRDDSRDRRRDDSRDRKREDSRDRRRQDGRDHRREDGRDHRREDGRDHRREDGRDRRRDGDRRLEDSREGRRDEHSILDDKKRSNNPDGELDTRDSNAASSERRPGDERDGANTKKDEVVAASSRDTSEKQDGPVDEVPEKSSSTLTRTDFKTDDPKPSEPSKKDTGNNVEVEDPGKNQAQKRARDDSIEDDVDRHKKRREEQPREQAKKDEREKGPEEDKAKRPEEPAVGRDRDSKNDEGDRDRAHSSRRKDVHQRHRSDRDRERHRGERRGGRDYREAIPGERQGQHGSDMERRSRVEPGAERSIGGELSSHRDSGRDPNRFDREPRERDGERRRSRSRSERADRDRLERDHHRRRDRDYRDRRRDGREDRRRYESRRGDRDREGWRGRDTEFERDRRDGSWDRERFPAHGPGVQSSGPYGPRRGGAQPPHSASRGFQRPPGDSQGSGRIEDGPRGRDPNQGDDRHTANRERDGYRARDDEQRGNDRRPRRDDRDWPSECHHRDNPRHHRDGGRDLDRR